MISFVERTFRSHKCCRTRFRHSPVNKRSTNDVFCRKLYAFDVFACRPYFRLDSYLSSSEIINRTSTVRDVHRLVRPVELVQPPTTSDRHRRTGFRYWIYHVTCVRPSRETLCNDCNDRLSGLDRARPVPSPRARSRLIIIAPSLLASVGKYVRTTRVIHVDGSLATATRDGGRFIFYALAAENPVTDDAPQSSDVLRK